MEPLVVYEIEARELLVTDLIRESPWARDIYEGITVFATDDPMVDGHFGTYFGALQRRQHSPNAWLQDLYHLHEFHHIRMWREGRLALKKTATRQTFNDWLGWIVDSESEASLMSECFAHLRIPGLRPLLFQEHDIWVDRFLHRPDIAVMTPTKISALEKLMRSERHRARHTPLDNDFIEHQIRNYGYQNIDWCGIWASPVGYGRYRDVPAWRVVEEHMGAMNVETDLDTHKAWLWEVSTCHNGKQVPFLNQALAFKPLYHETNRRFGNWILRT